jgi:hypothetical protein
MYSDITSPAKFGQILAQSPAVYQPGRIQPYAVLKNGFNQPHS